MRRSVQHDPRTADERKALRSRIKRFYLRFNREKWDDCLALIDPELVAAGKIDPAVYAQQLRAFKQVYGSIQSWYMRVSLHLDASTHQRDKRPFAYIYILWQDAAHEFHMFRERWVKDGNQWFTRVVGLVPNRPATATG